MVDGKLSNIYTCEDAGKEDAEQRDLSIPLSWQWTTVQVADTALATQDIKLEEINSYVILMTNEQGAGHWAAYDIGSSVMSIPEGVQKVVYPGGFYQAHNDFGGIGYTGPCPKDDLLHTYYITLSALRDRLPIDDPATATFQDVAAALQGNVAMASNVVQVAYTRGGPATSDPSAFQLLSDEFRENGFIPINFTCDGSNQSPQLNWRGVPEGTQSYALLVKDATDGTSQWVLYDLHADRTSLNRGIPYQPELDQLPEKPGFDQGLNDFGHKGYDGPCPPPYDGVHIYKFELLALDAFLTIDDPVTDNKVREAAQGHILASAVLNGQYEREEGGSTGLFKLTSPDFVDGGLLPANGDNHSQIESRSDFDTTLPGIQCGSDKQAPVDADSFYTDSSLDTCPLDEESTPDFDESISLGYCKVGNDNVVYICPNNQAACATSERIPKLWMGGGLFNTDPGQSPALELINIPPGTLSLVLLVADEDLVAASDYAAHWVAFNIDPDTTSIAADQGKNYFNGYFYQGLNDIWWRDTSRTIAHPLGDGELDERVDIGYWGPCLPGHHISYTAVALSKKLDFTDLAKVTYKDVVNAMQSSVLGTAKLKGITPPLP
jgi:Raf kinase inhibitor-like YbhB/YbcL family protein